MKYKLLGHSGVRVSEFCLGTMTLSKTNPWQWGADKETSLNLLKHYTEAGGNFIDTANNYTNGQSEEVIGEFVSGDRDRFVIASKFTLHNNNYKDDPNFGGNHRKNLLRSVEASLNRLDTDYLDILYLHVWDYTTSIREIMKTLNSLVDDHTVNYIAISDTPAWVVAQANAYAEARGWERFTAYQFPYALGRQDPEVEVMPYAKYNDLAMTPWGILRSGLLSGKYTRAEGGKGRIGRELKENEIKLASGVDEIADEIGVTSAQVAIAWVISRHEQIIPILGATKISHLEQALGSIEVSLNSDHLTRLGELSGFDVNTRFPQSFTASDNIVNLIHGDTAEKLINHRFHGY